MKKNKKNIFFTFIIMFIFFSCTSKEEKVEESRFLFGTYIKISVYTKDKNKSKQNIEKAFNEMERIDREYNSKVEGSLIYKLNNSKEIEINEELKEILFEIKKAYELSNKKYDITISPLLELWGFTDLLIDSKNLKIPKKEEIEYTKKYVDFSKVEIDGNKIKLNAPLKNLDTGSFLKGYAILKAKKILKDEGEKSAFLTSISSIDTIATKPNNKPWKIGIQNPEAPDEILGVVSLNDQAMGISGDYQTYVEINGEKYHHILDKEIGYPVKDKKMVVVICNNAFEADIYSTTFFLMPISEVISYANKNDNLEVMIVDKDMNIIKSNKFYYETINK